MLHSNMRTLYGPDAAFRLKSRFLDEIDSELLNCIGRKKASTCSKPSAPQGKRICSQADSASRRKRLRKVSGDYKVGTVVEHKTFGRGKVKSIARAEEIHAWPWLISAR